MPVKTGHVVTSQSTCRWLMLAYRCSIPAFIQFTHWSHHKSRVAKPIIVGEEGKKAEQTARGRMLPCARAEDRGDRKSCWCFKAGVYKVASSVSWRNQRGKTYGKTQCVCACVYELVCTEDFELGWTYSPVDMSEESTHSSKSQGTERETSTSTDFRALDLNAFLLTHLYTQANLTYRTAQS